MGLPFYLNSVDIKILPFIYVSYFCFSLFSFEKIVVMNKGPPSREVVLNAQSGTIGYKNYVRCIKNINYEIQCIFKKYKK